MLISIPDSALYPDSGFQSHSGLSQGVTDIGLSQGGSESGLHPHAQLSIVSHAPDSFGKESGNFSRVSVCAI